MNDITTRIDEQVSDTTRAAVANIVDYRIEAEYGQPNPGEAGAMALATASATLDLRPLYMQINGDDRHLAALVDNTLRILIADGLEARRCQCHTINGACPHGIDGRCTGHTEADVPPIRGALLCGRCHVAEYQN
jgi:hypothetical protein